MNDKRNHKQTDSIVEDISGISYNIDYIFYHTLSLFEQYPILSKMKKINCIKKLKKNYAALKKHKDSHANICTNKFFLCEAIISETSDEFENAIKFYDKSILAAKKNNLYKESGIANELAALLSKKNGNREITTLYANEAKDDYIKSGLQQHVDHIDLLFPTHINNQNKSHSDIFALETKSSTLDTPLQALDLASVLEASHMISGEIELEKLLGKLMFTMIENAGAERLFLLLEKDDGLIIESSCTAHKKDLKLNLSIPSDSPDMLPVSIINFVKRTTEPVILSNAIDDGMFTQDSYILQNKIKSVMCIPLINQNIFKGLVYLENRLTTGAFTSDRIEIIKLISTQATISLENSLLFEKEKQIEKELQQQNEEIHSQYEEMEVMNEELVSTHSELVNSNESLAIFKKFAEASGQGMGMTDMRGDITYANPALSEILGYSNPDELSGIALEQFYPNDLRKLFTEDILPMVLEGKEWVGELNISSRLNTLTPVIEGFFTIKDYDNKPLFVATIITDITERKKLEEQLFQSQKMDAVGRLAGGIAHDFNNLLTAISGYSDLIISDMTSEDPHYNDIKEILKAADRSSSLTKQLLAFSRKQMLQPIDINLNKVVQNIEKMIHRLIGEDVQFFTFLKDGLDTVTADKGQIEQIIMNIIINARDAMPTGGNITLMTGNITIDAETSNTIPDSRPGNFVCISIEDTGMGIEESHVDKIFEPFFSTKGPDKGTGLGLSVVYGITAQHNGWINVKSQLGSGTTFDIYLPSHSSEPEEVIIEVKKTIIKGQGECILLIEDQQEVLNFTTKALTKYGYIVKSATNGKSAIELFNNEDGNFDLIFSDVVLPDISGTQIISYMKEKKPNIPVILSSGYTDQKSQWDIIREKGYRFLEKPYALNTLLKTIHDVLNDSD